MYKQIIAGMSLLSSILFADSAHAQPRRWERDRSRGEVGRSAAQLLGRTLTGAVIGLRGGGSALSYDLFTGTPVARPEGFQAARTVAGFSITWTL